MKKKNQKSAARVWVPPESAYQLAPRPHLQLLPLLPWDYFQRLCARLAQQNGDVEFSQEYGLPGQAQEGIDIYVRRRASGRYAVWQCKRYSEISAGLITQAVDEFLAGDWMEDTDEFVLCVSAPLEDRNLADEIIRQTVRLRARNIALIPQGIVQLSERLKTQPELVHDFFGMQAVKDFCGEEAAGRISHRRLAPDEVSKLRLLLRRCYAHHFESVDPGLPSLTNPITGGPSPLPLPERFVIPDILEPRQSTHTRSVIPSTVLSTEDVMSGIVGQPDATAESSRIVTVVSDVRKNALNWLTEGNLSVIIGDPGIGKSSLLRYVLLDLLSERPRHEHLAIQWGNRLPVWIPFAMWTRMVAENERGCSLGDVIAAWLSKVSASPELQALIKEALDDSRLLLFVDGLDEWSNEVAAGTTIALLEQFVGEREVPAVATSRPLGFDRLGGLSGKWRRAKLAGLTTEQQCEFSAQWFFQKARRLRATSVAGDDVELRENAAREARAFIEELQRESRLARLGEIPLLLSGLIALSAQNVRLPRNRFKAYQELTRLLLQEQPQRREKAAHARTTVSKVSPETRERALARLAYAIHQSPGSDSIKKRTAAESLRGFFVEYLKKTDADALEMADQILAVSAETIGILVEKSPQELGFPHRAFQEYLAARHMKDLPFEEQKQLSADFFGNPQWHDVLLCLCHLNTRTGEVDSLVEVVQKAALPIELEPARLSFLAELAFDDLNCSASCAADIAERVFREIEIGLTARVREDLMGHALDGLFSDVLRHHVETRIRKWYPDRFEYRSSVYEAMASWPRESATISALWRGLLDTNEWNQRSASETIARLLGSDADYAQHLLHLIFTPNEPRIAAYALHALCTGWPTNEEISPLLCSARDSVEPLLQAVAICHRVKRREHDVQDRDLLLEFAKRSPSYHWKEDVIGALLDGWPKDPEIKRKALQTISAKQRWKGPFSPESAGQILLEGFPQDDEVAIALAALFRTEDYPQHNLGINVGWSALVKAFKGHPLLREAVDDFLANKEERFWDCELCLVSMSPRALTFLTKPSDKTGVIGEHQARWLLQGWGMDHPIVAQALNSLAKSTEVIRVLHLLPQILADKEECRKQLMSYLGHDVDFVVHLALMGLIQLGVEADGDVVDAALKKFAGQVPCGVKFIGIENLIAAFPGNSFVRELAVHQVQHRSGSIGVVAYTYSKDPQMRELVLQQVSPLPSTLRIRLVDRLVLLAAEDDFVYMTLKEFDEDTDALTKTAAAIGYARAVRTRGDDERLILSQLSENAKAVGPDHGERRQAAFAALLELDHLDLINTLGTTADTLKHMEFSGVRRMNLRLASHLAKNWPKVHAAFGSDFWKRVGWTSDEFFEEMISNTFDEGLIETLLGRMESRKGQPGISVTMLRVRSRTWRNTERLRQLCLQLVTTFVPSNWGDVAPCILAAEILGEQFAVDSSVRKQLEDSIDKKVDMTAIAIALCIAWPDSAALLKIRDDSQKRLMTPAQVHLSCLFTSADKFVDVSGRMFHKLTGGIWDFLPTCARAFETRFRRDANTRNVALTHLEMGGATATEKCNLSQLVRRTENRPERLRAWARCELGNQYRGKQLPDSALDIFSGQIRPVAEVLTEVVLN